MATRISEDKITELGENEVFVYGSNERGNNIGGTALFAEQNFGARRGKGFGYTFTDEGRTFAIPTMDWGLNPLSIQEIEFYVNRFIAYTKTRKDLTFLVTPIGTGIAKFAIEDIAPLFKEALNTQNINLPKSFWNIINQPQYEISK